MFNRHQLTVAEQWPLIKVHICHIQTCGHVTPVYTPVPCSLSRCLKCTLQLQCTTLLSTMWKSAFSFTIRHAIETYIRQYIHQMPKRGNAKCKKYTSQQYTFIKIQYTSLQYTSVQGINLMWNQKKLQQSLRSTTLYHRLRCLSYFHLLR